MRPFWIEQALFNDGELAPAGELVLPGSAFASVIREDEVAFVDAELAEKSTGHRAAVQELAKHRASQPKSKWRECHGRKSRLSCDAIFNP